MCFCHIADVLCNHIASVNGNAAVARVLIEFGANVNQTSASGQTPLILAAVGGHAELAKVLLEAGADLGATNPHGQTALDIATALEKKVMKTHCTHRTCIHSHHLHYVESGGHIGRVPATTWCQISVTCTCMCIAMLQI